MNTYIHTYVHTYIRTYVHTYIRTYEIVAKARVPQVAASTAARSIKRVGLPAMSARKAREKPLRTPEHEEERMRIGKIFRRKPEGYFNKDVDLIMDNKQWPIPRTAKAKRYSRMRKVRFHLRNRAEGLQSGFTKLRVKKNRVNPGASVNVCAGIMKNRIRIFHYLPPKWNGQVASELTKA